MPLHTPGPWTLGNENNECCEVILGTEHNLVCSLDRQDLNTSRVVISRDEMLANAHLIIAAPQMLEALKAEVCSAGCPEWCCGKMRAAIKLAEGDL